MIDHNVFNLLVSQTQLYHGDVMHYNLPTFMSVN